MSGNCQDKFLHDKNFIKICLYWAGSVLSPLAVKRSTVRFKLIYSNFTGTNLLLAMKKLLTILVLFSTMLSCERFSAPKCKITLPESGTTFTQGDFITISIDAYDKNGFVKKVKIYINEIVAASIYSSPYTFHWKTKTSDKGDQVIRAVAIDDEGLFSEHSISVFIEELYPKGTFIDSRDGIEYKYIKIGEQFWMAENLAYLPKVDKVQCTSGDQERKQYWVYDYHGTNVDEAKTTDNYQKFGVLYNGNAALVSCPGGWHLPDDGEWMSLERFLGMSEADVQSSGYRRGENINIANKLKSDFLWLDNANGTNETGFNALPAGARHSRGHCFFANMHHEASFWTSTPDQFYRTINTYNNGIRRDHYWYFIGLSVRCVKD